MIAHLIRSTALVFLFGSMLLRPALAQDDGWEETTHGEGTDAFTYRTHDFTGSVNVIHRSAFDAEQAKMLIDQAAQAAKESDEGGNKAMTSFSASGNQVTVKKGGGEMPKKTGAQQHVFTMPKGGAAGGTVDPSEMRATALMQGFAIGSRYAYVFRTVQPGKGSTLNAFYFQDVDGELKPLADDDPVRARLAVLVEEMKAAASK